MKCHRCNFVITEDRPSIWVDALTGGSICGRVNGAIVFHSPEPVTGQPAPPTPRFCLHKRTVYILDQAGSGACVESLMCKDCLKRFKEVAQAAAQPLTPPQPPLEKKFQAILERERTQVSAGVTAIEDVLAGRSWLTEGRGPYEWDDDRWHSEFAAASEEIRQALVPLKKIAGDLSDCPTTQAEVEAARQAAPPSLTAPPAVTNIEGLAKLIYESIFDAGFDGAKGAERECYLNAARQVAGRYQPAAYLTAEELAPFLEPRIGRYWAGTVSTLVCSLPGIKVVRG